MLVQILVFSKKGKNEYISGNVIDDPPFFFAVLWPQEVAILLHIEFWAVFFKILWLLNLWVSGIFFFKEIELVLFIAPRHLVGRVRKQKPVDAPLQGLSFSPGLTSWIATHQKLPCSLDNSTLFFLLFLTKKFRGCTKFKLRRSKNYSDFWPFNGRKI